jgi:hypothetical protein
MSQIPHACNLVRIITKWWQAGTLLRGGKLEGRAEFSRRDYTGETRNTIENGHGIAGISPGQSGWCRISRLQPFC